MDLLETENNLDFLSFYLDYTLDIHDVLLNYAKDQCLPLLDESDATDFVDFVRSAQFARGPVGGVQTLNSDDTPETPETNSQKSPDDGWTTV